jgi:hypothetical protein
MQTSTTMSPETSSHDGAPSDASSASTLRPKALGWLSIALGTAALAMPSTTARMLGAPRSKKTKALLRGVGARELGVGVGLLTRTQSSAAMTWLRVAGDLMDLSLLAAAMTARRARRQRLFGAVGVIAGVALLDLAAALMQTREERAQRA